MWSEREVDRAQTRLRHAQAVAALAGAGVIDKAALVKSVVSQAELAAIAVDAAIAEAVALLEVHAEGLKESYAKLFVQDCAERILAAQFGGYAPAPAHLGSRRR